jgi:beta-lactamase superfamily II metal-dependent hydrolase
MLGKNHVSGMLAWKHGMISLINMVQSPQGRIFLAPHHGSKNCIHEDAFKAIDPSFVIVSVVKGVDYDYEFYSKLAKRQVLSTKYYGNIKIDIKDDGTYLPIIVEKNGSK